MSLMLIVLAVFFGMVLCCTGLQLRRILRTTAGGRRYFGSGTSSD